MFDLGWSELLLIAVVAVIVIGPKDLPHALRTLGQWMSQVRGMAHGFRRQFDDMVRESELDQLREQANSISRMDYGQRYDPTASAGTTPPAAPAVPPAETEAMPPPSAAEPEPVAAPVPEPAERPAAAAAAPTAAPAARQDVLGGTAATS